MDNSESLENPVFPEPLAICKVISKFPLSCFAIGSLFHVSFVVISIVLFLLKFEVFVIVFDDVPLIDKDYEGYQCFKAMWILEMSRLENKIDWTLFYRDFEKYNFLLYFDGEEKNVLTPESLSEMYKIENTLMKKLSDDAMAVIVYSEVVPPMSITNMLLKVNGNDQTFENLTFFLDVLTNDATLAKDIKSIICKGLVKIDSEYYARAVISVIYMIPGKTSYIHNVWIYILRDYYNNPSKYWKIFYNDRETFLVNLKDTALRDLKLTIGSLIYIYIFTFLQTRSMFLTIFGISSIFTSFFIANFIHTVIMGIKFFGIFHILAIYIILGIGCDDLYVFLDRWRSSYCLKFPSLAHRLSDAYRSANVSMFITSLTTGAAFSIMIFTPLITLSTFAIFTVLLVIINYVSILLYFPTVIIVNHLYFETVTKPDKIFAFMINVFGVHYFNLLKKKFISEIILGVFALMTFLSIILMIFKFEISDKFPTLLGSGTMYGDIKNLNKYCFSTNNFDVPLQVSLVSGLAGVQSNHCKFWEYKCKLHLVFDSTYDISNIDVQIALKKLCHNLKYSSKSLDKDLALKKSKNSSEIDCFILEMDKYFQQTFPLKIFQVPWNITKFQKLSEYYSYIYDYHDIPSTFPYYFESAMDFWLFESYTFGSMSSEFMRIYKRVLYRQITNMTTKLRRGYKYGFKLVVSHLVINTTFYTKSSGYYARVQVFDNWIKFKNDINKNLPRGLNKMMVCSLQMDISINGYFHWIWVQRIVNSIVLKGIFLGLVLSFPIILCATMNIYESLCIILSTALTTLSIVTFLPIMGWKLGFLEGTNLTLIVGLSVDYIVHMGLSYHRSQMDTPEDRLKEMLTEMPISVISGSLTTLGACSFLFFCKVKFLFQYGFFLFITIGLASVYALIFYPSLICRFGPSKNVGQIRNIFKRNRIKI